MQSPIVVNEKNVQPEEQDGEDGIVRHCKIPSLNQAGEDDARMAVTDEPETLPELGLHHIVLGRYGNNKFKILTDSTKIYKKFREKIDRKRSYSDQEIHDLRRQITQHIRKELKLPPNDLPLVQFVVDIQKIQHLKDTKQRDILLQSNPCRYRHPNAEGVIFVQDETDFFFKHDLREHRPDCKRKAKNKKKKKEEETNEPSTPPIPSLPTPTARTIDDMELSVSNLGYGGNLDEMSSVGFFSLDDGSMPSTTARGRTPAARDKATTTMKFKFVHGSGTLEHQVQQFCGQWLFDKMDPNNLNEMLRKPQMVSSFQSHFQTYQHLLLVSHINPFQKSPLPSLRDLPQQLLLHCATILLNGMVEAYEQYPTSCLEGETNDWAGKGNATIAAGGGVASLQQQPMQKRPDDDDDGDPSQNLAPSRRKASNNPCCNPRLVGPFTPDIFRSGPSSFAITTSGYNSGVVVGEANQVCVARSGPPSVITAGSSFNSEPPSISSAGNSSIVAELPRAEEETCTSDDAMAAIAKIEVKEEEEGETTTTGDDLELMKIVAARSRSASDERNAVTISHPPAATEYYDEGTSTRTKEEKRFSGLQRILAASQESTRSLATMRQQSVRSLPVLPSHRSDLEAMSVIRGSVANSTQDELVGSFRQSTSLRSVVVSIHHASGEAAMSQSVRSSEAEGTTGGNDFVTNDGVEIQVARYERDLHWTERCRKRSKPLLHHLEIFDCNGELFRALATLQRHLTMVLGIPVGCCFYFVLVEMPLFFFYLVFCGVVAVTCCLLFLVSFWEFNFWDPTTPLHCRDWGTKVPIFVVGSIGYLLATPLVLFTLVVGWIADYICHRLSAESSELNSEH